MENVATFGILIHMTSSLPVNDSRSDVPFPPSPCVLACKEFGVVFVSHLVDRSRSLRSPIRPLSSQPLPTPIAAPGEAGTSVLNIPSSDSSLSAPAAHPWGVSTIPGRSVSSKIPGLGSAVAVSSEDPALSAAAAAKVDLPVGDDDFDKPGPSSSSASASPSTSASQQPQVPQSQPVPSLLTFAPLSFGGSKSFVGPSAPAASLFASASSAPPLSLAAGATKPAIAQPNVVSTGGAAVAPPSIFSIGGQSKPVWFGAAAPFASSSTPSLTSPSSAAPSPFPTSSTLSSIPSVRAPLMPSSASSATSAEAPSSSPSTASSSVSAFPAVSFFSSTAQSQYQSQSRVQASQAQSRPAQLQPRPAPSPRMPVLPLPASSAFPVPSCIAWSAFSFIVALVLDLMGKLRKFKI